MPDSSASAPNDLPRHHAPLRAWLALLAVLMACAPSLLLGIDVRLSTHTMENVALVTSQETWLRMADGDSRAWLVSTNDGVPRLEKPPLLAWLNLLAWSDLDPAMASPQQLTFRARRVSVSLGLIMLAAIFWMGCTLGDVRLAALAALMVGSTFFFQRQARTASYDIHFVAWTTLAVASGLWAIGPLASPARATAPRRVLGWSLCALALWAAVMSKNPLPYVLALPPLIAGIVLLSRARRADALGLTAAALIPAAPVAWWYGHVFALYPEVAERHLGREVIQPRAGDFQPVYYYLGLLGLVFPWTLWLAGGLIEPFRIGERERRRAAMFAFFWFAFIFVALSIPAAKQQRYVLAAMPPVGLLVAMFFRQHHDRARNGVPDRLFDVVSAGTWIVLALASVLMPMFLVMHDQWLTMAARWIDDPEPIVEPMSWLWAGPLIALLLAVSALGWRWRKTSPWRSAVALGAWMLVLMTAFWQRESQAAPARVQAFVDEAARLHAIVGEAPLVSLRWIERTLEGWDLKVNEEFRFYYGRLIKRLSRDQFDAWLARQRQPAFVMVRPNDEASEFLRTRGLQLVDHAQADKDDRQELWRWPGDDASD